MNSTVWVNFDKPTRYIRVHRHGCKWEKSKKETEFKGIREVRRDGGWFDFPDIEAAREFHASIESGKYRFWFCRHCSKVELSKERSEKAGTRVNAL